MDEIIKQLKTPEDCTRVIEKYTLLINQARQRSLELRVQNHENNLLIEKELLKAIYAYEDILSKKNNRKTYASRTLQMVKRHGIIGAAERAVNRNVDAQGYKMLVEMGMQHLTFETIIAKHPEYFSAEAVRKANKRLEELKEIQVTFS